MLRMGASAKDVVNVTLSAEVEEGTHCRVMGIRRDDTNAN